MRIDRPPTRPALRVRFGALACLFAFLAGIPAFLPMAFAALGSLDRQHRVAIEERADGLVVVLRHTGDAHAPQDHHDPLAQALTAFTQLSGTTQDHVLTIAQTGAVQVSAPAALPVIAAQTPAPAPKDSRLVLPLPLSVDACTLSPRPPPIRALALVCLRSISLRI